MYKINSIVMVKRVTSKHLICICMFIIIKSGQLMNLKLSWILLYMYAYNKNYYMYMY